MDKYNQYSAQNPNRIKNWIKNNIHMVWDQIEKLKTIPNQPMLLRITFYENSFPVVMQWEKMNSPEMKFGTDKELSWFTDLVDLWYIQGNFANINEFADWLDKYA